MVKIYNKIFVNYTYCGMCKNNLKYTSQELIISSRSEKHKVFIICPNCETNIYLYKYKDKMIFFPVNIM